MVEEAALVVLFALAAGLYASVGHGGASAYLALLALMGRARPEVAATVLLMNIVVSTFAFRSYRKAGFFDGRMAVALVAFSAPAALIGGLLPVSPRLFSLLLGGTLLLAGGRFLLPGAAPKEPRQPRGTRFWVQTALFGTGLGLLSGLTGVGGGVYLSPLLLVIGWTNVKETAAVSSAFILANSLSGLSGRLLGGESLDLSLLPLLVAATLGGMLGAWWGARRARSSVVRQLLGLVLLVAAVKLLFAA